MKAVVLFDFCVTRVGKKIEIELDERKHIAFDDVRADDFFDEEMDLIEEMMIDECLSQKTNLAPNIRYRIILEVNAKSVKHQGPEAVEYDTEVTIKERFFVGYDDGETSSAPLLNIFGN